MNLRGINSRILLVPILAVFALAVVGLIAVRTIASVTVAEHEARARVVAEAATKIVELFEAKAAKGELSQDAAQLLAKEALRAIRYDGSEYVSAHDLQNLTVAHGTVKEREGKSATDDRDSNGTYYIRDMVKAAQAGGGFNYYLWSKTPNTPPVRKVAYSKLSAGWKWAVTSGIYLDDVDAASWNSAVGTAGAVALVALVTLALAFWLGRRISGPILSLTSVTHRLAEGDLSAAVPALDRRDEIGTMAKAIEVLKEKSAEAVQLRAAQAELAAKAEVEKKKLMSKMADDFDSSVRAALDAVGSAATEMRATSQSMSATAEETSAQATTVAAAAEEASANVQTVAAATEELSSSVAEIGRQVSQSTKIAGQAVVEADRTNVSVQGLSEAAHKIGDVVKLISDIASQTNLLALNATIEAARAGDAGKGFAVVASEVKSLANQTAKATEEISAQVAAMQAATGEAVQAIRGIGGTIGTINEIATTIAAAVEEQGAATQEIARNVHEAAQGTGQVSSNIVGVNQAAAETGAAAGMVLTAAEELGKQAETLRADVDKFLANIRAA